MAVSSWMFRGRNLRYMRYNRGRNENEDYVQLDEDKPLSENIHDILHNITKLNGITESKRLSYLKNFVKLVGKPDVNYNDLGYTPEEIMYCLRPLAFHESVQLKNATFRAVRHFIKTEEHVDVYNQLKYDFLVARQITAAGIQLCRKILVVAPHKFTYAPVQAIVSFTHPNHCDKLQAAALAFLAEIAVLNPDIFITCGGVSALVRNLPYLRSTRLTEALLGPLLYLMNMPETRAKAGIDLTCLADSVYMDRALNNKNNNNIAESSVRWSTETLICLLRTWTGVLHLCQGKRTAVNSIVNTLYISHLQKPMLSALYELFLLTEPDWTDEMWVGLEGVDPSRWQPWYRLSDGFLAMEAVSTFPHLAASRVNLVEAHLAVLLYAFLRAQLLDAIVHIVVSEDTFLSVKATILLGQLLHLIHTLLPPQVVGLTPGLPNLLSYAVRGRPVTVIPECPQSSLSSHWQGGESEDILPEPMESVKGSLNNLREGGSVASRLLVKGVDIAQIFGSGFNFEKIEYDMGRVDLEVDPARQERALGAVCALASFHKTLSSPSSSASSLYMAHLLSWLRGPSPSVQSSYVVSGSCDDAVRESGVLSVRDPTAWNWDTIRAVLKNYGESLRKSADSNRRLFLKKLVHFLLPNTGQYSRTEIGSDRKVTNRLTLAALDLLSVLLPASSESEPHRLLTELLQGIKTSLEEIVSGKSAHDCLFSPQNVTNSLCQDYFLMIGHLSKYSAGRSALNKTGIHQLLMDLVTKTNHDCYIKLVTSSLDYSHDETARKVLNKVLESKSVSARLYGARFLHAMIRVGVSHDTSLLEYVVGQVVLLLGDEDPGVSSIALLTLQEACDSRAYLEAIIEQRPCLMRLGDPGLLLLVRCLSKPSGFRALHQANFVTAQLSKWGTHFNYRYVNIVENLLHNCMTTCGSKALINLGNSFQDSSVPISLPNKEEGYLPPHLYQQLAHHPEGLALVLKDEHVQNLTQVLANPNCRTQQGVLELKAALYALSGIAAFLDLSVIINIINVATKCEVYSVRATAVYSLCNVATSKEGADKLDTLGWYCVRHNRHDKWPVLKTLLDHQSTVCSEDDDKEISDTTSEDNKSQQFQLTEDNFREPDEFYWGIPGDKTRRVRERKCLTLPPSSCPPIRGTYGRSYSESKAEGSDVDYRYDISERKSRSNSYTDSSTSGDSNLGRRRTYTLSPIPSDSSLLNLRTSYRRRTSFLRNISRCNGSRESLLKSLPDPNPLPDGLTTYGNLKQMSPQKSQFNEFILQEEVNDTDNLDFSVVEETPSVKEDSDSDLDNEHFQRTNTSFVDNERSNTMPCYVGICVPAILSSLFPKEDRSAMVVNHVSFMADNLNVQGLEDLKNPSFHKEICFLGPRGFHNTMISTSESEGQYMIDEEDLEDLEKEALQDNSVDSSITDVPNIAEHPMPIIFKSRIVIRSEISRMVEQLSNPILHKTCKQSLLQIKQAHGDLFQDICVLSDVCYILSTCHIRIASRDFIHELFDTPVNQIWADVANYLEQIEADKTKKTNGINTC